jgi:hypothetical protein
VGEQEGKEVPFFFIGVLILGSGNEEAWVAAPVPPSPGSPLAEIPRLYFWICSLPVVTEIRSFVFQVVAVSVFLALAFAFYVFFAPFVGRKVFQYVVMGIYTPLVRLSSLFCRYHVK